MKPSLNFRVLFGRILIICIFPGVVPVQAFSKPAIHSSFERYELAPVENVLIEQDEPKVKQAKTKKTAIKVVPKSRRQVKPTVVKPKVKVKPVKIIRPKIKRP
ncbi:hypothetical protein [Pedobacter immunditicola]|uniref:hypothetical protein n=1 Tax=Pedobacter immunditicola TaxID=3133440 RepID=UPI0030B52FD2